MNNQLGFARRHSERVAWFRTLASTLAASCVLLSAAALHAQTPPALDATALGNAEYLIPDIPGGKAQLKDGLLDDQTNHIRVQLVDTPRASGDVDGDGQTDWLVHLAANTGGSGVFSYLVVVANDNGKAKQIDLVLLGDRVTVRGFSVPRRGEVRAVILDRRVTDAMATRPTITVVRTFRWMNGKLVASGPLSADAINYAQYPLEGAKDGKAVYLAGKFEDKEAQLSSSILPRPRANGDIDGDGSVDAVVAVSTNAGGSGTIDGIAAVLNDRYGAVPTATMVIGNRITLTGIVIRNGQITVNYLDRREGQPMSARPSVRKSRTFVLKGNLLVELRTGASSAPIEAVYTCPNGKTFSVTFTEGQASLTMDGKTEVLPQQISGSGFRYGNSNLLLLGKGNEALLQDGNGNNIVTGCMAPDNNSMTQPISPTLPSGTLTGTVSYRQRIALPPNAEIQVQLEDISRADAVAVILAEQRIPSAGKNVPFAFELKYDPAKIVASGRYNLRARITVDGQLRWMNTSSMPVLTNGAPATGVNVNVDQIAPPADTGASGTASNTVSNTLAGTSWVLVESSLDGKADPALGATLNFGNDGRLSGKTGCNQMSGTYTVDGDKLTVKPLATTLMACADPAMKQEDWYVAALQTAQRYEITDAGLRIYFGAGMAFLSLSKS